ncbi:polysaccharide biosynthesis C-terminal domain-containing protein [Mesonia sp. K7]|uniref:oligosaccharide flippase family protein n=1 Tax=Mesonia sp. K7 TaxID=2218606 RepID=UPI000DAA832B|nr:polysaccharide biosynthesis C-terminal domain-containing protein [Mesonia sp. K7]PZD79297.1 lipopolysaccharide biosynthesis protein [Mesonia sp. K7]
MGIIFKQSYQNLLVTYFGFLIGALNVLFLYPKFLTPENYGLITYLLSVGTLIWPFLGWGFSNTIIKFYSAYKDKVDQYKLLSLALVFPLFVGLLLGVFGIALQEKIHDYFSDNPLVRPYVYLILMVAVSIAYFEVFFAWSKLQLKSVFGNFLKEVFHRALTCTLLLVYFFELIDLNILIHSIAVVYIIRAIVMGVYAFKLLPIKFIFGFPTAYAKVFKYSLLILIAGFVSTSLLDLDKFMIEYFLPISEVSIYGIATYIAAVIVVPSRAMHQITLPITANLLNQKNYSELKSLLKKSSITLLVIGGFIFTLIVGNIQALYSFLPEDYQLNFLIIILLGLVKIYESALGNANSILYNSDYYRLVLYSGIFAILMAVLLNIWLIPTQGILGAALATGLAYGLYNTTKLLIVYYKFKIHPFSKKSLYVFLFVCAVSSIFYHIAFTEVWYIDIGIKSILIGVIFFLGVKYLNFSEEIKQSIDNLIHKKRIF